MWAFSLLFFLAPSANCRSLFNDLGTTEEFIWNGQNISIKDVPFQVSFTNKLILFSGAIITPTHIIADGLIGYEINKGVNFTIRVGSDSFKTGGTEVFAKKAYVHPEFNPCKGLYDISIVELTEPLKFSDKVQKIKVANQDTPIGTPVRVSGWGVIEEVGELNPVIAATTVPLISREDCQSICGLKVPEMDLCIGGNRTGPNWGDEYVPVTYNNELIGMASIIFVEPTPLPSFIINLAYPEVRKFIRDVAHV